MRLSKLRIAILIAATLALASCKSTTDYKDIAAPEFQAIETAREAADNLRDRIDAIFLVKCRAPVFATGTTKQAVLIAEKENADREKECRLKHAALVDIIAELSAPEAGQ